MNTEDQELVMLAKREPLYYESLYRKYAPKVFNYFWYRTGHDRDLSEDLMQETFLRAFKHLSKFRQRSYSYLTYLLSIAHNLLVDHYRKPKAVPIEDAGEVPFEITQDIERKSDAEALWHAIQTLPAPSRDILLMHYQRNMPIKDIARVMGTSENAVKLSLSRTRRRLAAHPRLKDMAKFADTSTEYTSPRFLRKR